MMAITNLELALINILFIEGLDGMNAMELILGKTDLVDEYKVLLKKSKKKRKKGLLVERDNLETRLLEIIGVTRLIYPALILFNLCMVFGW